MKHRYPLFILAAAVGAILAGCSSDPANALDWNAIRSMQTALCAAAAQAEGGDLNRANATFANRAHEPLHVLAGVVEARDRGVAGRLLEAKQNVEAAFAQRDKDVSTSLRVLIERTDESAQFAGGDPAPPCKEG